MTNLTKTAGAFALSLTVLSGAIAATGAHAASGELVLYTSQPSKDAQQTVDAFMKKHPKVKVSWIRQGTTKMMAKVRAEIAAGGVRADLLLIADMVTMEGLKQEGRLLAYPGAKLDGYDPALYDKDKTYFSTKLITTGIIYNTKGKMKPASWKDLLKPEAKGQIAMPSPLTSGAATIHMQAIKNNAALGWDYYKGLASQQASAAGGNGRTLKRVATGEKLYGVIVDFLAIRAKAKGSPVAFVFPKEGVSMVTEPIAIMKNTKNPEAAKAFVDFLLSKEGQQFARKQGYLPAHSDVPGPDGFPDRKTIKLMSFDPAKALSDIQASRKAFADLFAK